jgi:hypothetical protein
MLTSDRITPRPAGKALATEAAATSRIEYCASELAKIIKRDRQLDALCDDLEKVAQREDDIGRQAHALCCRLRAEMDTLTCKKIALEELVSWEAPANLREAFLLMLLCGWRHANANDGEAEAAAVGRAVSQITVFLEGHSSTAAEELGLASYLPGAVERLDETLLESIMDRAAALLQCAQAEPCAEAAS